MQFKKDFYNGAIGPELISHENNFDSDGGNSEVEWDGWVEW